MVTIIILIVLQQKTKQANSWLIYIIRINSKLTFFKHSKSWKCENISKNETIEIATILRENLSLTNV